MIANLLKTLSVFVTLIAMTTCENYYMRISAGKDQLKCHQSQLGLIPGKIPEQCHEMTEFARDFEACLLYLSSDPTRIFRDQWLCVTATLPENTVIDIDALSLASEVHTLSNKFKIVGLKDNSAFSLIKHDTEKLEDKLIQFGVQKSSNSKLKVHIYELVWNPSSVPQKSQDALPALTPQSFTIDPAQKVMNLVLEDVRLPTSSQISGTEALKKTEVDVTNQNYFKIDYYIEETTLANANEKLVFNGQIVKGNQKNQFTKSFATIIPQSIWTSEIDLNTKLVEAKITVKQGTLFDFLEQKDPKSLSFSAAEYTHGTQERLKQKASNDPITYRLQSNVEYLQSLFFALEPQDKVWDRIYFETDEQKIKKNPIMITMRLDSDEQLAQRHLSLIEDKEIIKENFGVSVYQLLEIDSPIHGRISPSLFRSIFSELEQSNGINDSKRLKTNPNEEKYKTPEEYARKFLQNAYGENSQCNLNSVKKLERIEFNDDTEKFFVCSATKSEQNGLDVPCDLIHLRNRIKFNRPEKGIRVKKALFAVAGAEEGDQLCTDGINVYYVHFETHNLLWKFAKDNTNKFEDHFKISQLLI